MAFRFIGLFFLLIT